MSKVTLKWGGKAAIGNNIVGTWSSTWENGGAAFYGETLSGEKSPGMKKRELREWFAKEASQ